MINIEMYPKHCEGVIYRDIEREAVVLNLDNGFYYSLNQLGTEIWEMCDGTSSIEEMIQCVCDDYEVTYDQAKNDILELVDDLIREGLVTVDETPFESSAVKEGSS